MKKFNLLSKALLPIILLQFVCIGLAFSQAPQYVRTSGLKAWYSFTGDSTDDYANLNLQNLGASLSSDRFSISNSAYIFDGSATYMRRDNFPYPETKDVVISLWYKRSSTDGSGTIMSYGNNEIYEPGTWYLFAYPDGTVQLSTQFSGLALNANDNSDSNWHHIVFVRNDNDLLLYLDGELASTGSTNSSWAANKNIFIGTTPALGWNFNGKVDDIGIWKDHGNNFTHCDVLKLYYSHTYTNPDNQSVASGGTATFETAAHDELTFQWQADSGTGFVNLSNAGQNSGATSNQLTVSNVNSSNNNTLYRCVLNYGPCTISTEAATLSVGSATAIAEHDEQPTLSVYPNPSNGNFVIESSSGIEGPVRVIVTDLAGKVVHEFIDRFPSDSQTKSIHLNLPAGMYNLTMLTERGKHSQAISIVN